MKRVAWIVRGAWQRAGWPAGVGVALCLLAASLAVTVLWPRELERRELLARLDALARAAPVPAAAHAPSGREQLDRFHAWLPTTAAAAEVTERLFALAAETGIALEQGEYRFTRAPDASIGRYQIALPVNGPYPAMRAFVARALEEVPALALEGIGFQRDAASTPGASTQIRFVLYVAVR